LVRAGPVDHVLHDFAIGHPYRGSLLNDCIGRCGDLLLALPERDAERLAAMLGFPPAGGWGGMAESALVESGNIVGSAFVTAVGTLVGEKLLLSVPTFARGSGRACVEALVAHAGSIALATRLTASAGDAGEALEGLILVMPEPERVARLLSHLELR
jgi:chemotaxis protein CheC